MNGTRLLLSVALVTFPAVAFPAVRKTSRPRAWTIAIAGSLGGGLALIEASLIHASLPLVFSSFGLDRLAQACRALGGHVLGAVSPVGVLAGLAAVVIAVAGFTRAAATLRAQAAIRSGVVLGDVTAFGEHEAILLPMAERLAVAVPGATPRVVLSSRLVQLLKRPELDAVLRHEMAHIRHHHLRFLLLAQAVGSGLRFLPWARRSTQALRLALERWADEDAAAMSAEERAHVRSALDKVAGLGPSAFAADRLRALGPPEVGRVRVQAWAWATAATATLPIAMGLSITLVTHLNRVAHLASNIGG